MESPVEYKYLEVRLDSTLKLDSHMKNTGTTVSYQVFKLGKLREQMLQDVAILVYKQTVLPYYCSFLFEGAKKTSIKRLQTLQNSALRVCTRTFDQTY